ncbi:MAG: hypothetical protein KQ78_01850 [Candidatus Izimaplasma bacterium HR2]|nr:MAG: hypothetical protein KQ78_01850 [Candidatus Izimaplasma bacterium HR2]
MNFEQIKELAKKTIVAKPNAQFSYDGETITKDQMLDTLRTSINELAGDYKSYRRNKNLVFELIEETADLYLPAKVKENIGRFAEIKDTNIGDKPKFNLKLGKNRGKQFVTKVGTSGIYEVFRLDSKQFGVETERIGGAGVISLERLLTGAEDLVDILEVILEGIEDEIYGAVQTALQASLASGAAASNYGENAGFSATILQALVNSISAYGKPVIYCTPEFAQTIVPDTGYVGDADKNDKRQLGYIGRWNGIEIVVMPQSYVDETNAVKVFDPQLAYIIPAGREKIVKVLFEGQTVVEEITNRNRTREIAATKRIGVAVLFNNHFAILKNSSL